MNCGCLEGFDVAHGQATPRSLEAFVSQNMSCLFSL